LLLNAAWPALFVGLRSPAAGLVAIVGLLALVGLTIRRFRWVDRPAAALFIPYFGWVLYDVYLNAGFWWLN